MRFRFVLVLLWTAVVVMAQQQTAPPAPAKATPQAAKEEETVTFSSNSQLVVEAVTVTDRQGKPIRGLTPKDFTVSEDGKPQSIAFVEFQTLPDQQAPELPAYTATAVAVPRLARSRIAPEKPGDIRYRDRRLLVLYFDMTAMPPADQFRALGAAQKFVRTQMTQSDLLAIMRFEDGAVQVLEDFTADRERLLTTLQTLTVGEEQGFEASMYEAAASDTGAAFGQNDGEFNLFNTDRQLSALQTAAKMLSVLSEKKVLLYFASGLRLNGVDNQAQLNATINAAVRAGVSFWPIDARGLVAEAPLGDASRGSQGGRAMYTGAAAGAMISGFQRSQDTLYALAADTGGKALIDTNDLGRGMVEAQNATASYYLIGYYTSNAAPDGKFRRIKITLNGERSADLRYRQGYYAAKEFSKFSTADKERQLEDALMLGDPVTELTVALELNYFQLNRAEYFVPIAVKIPGSELALAKKRGAEHTVIDFIGEIKEGPITVANLRDKVDIKLSGTTAAELVKRPVAYDAGFTLLPGSYTLKFLARDATTGRMGTYMRKFVVPNLDQEQRAVPTSTVILSSQSVRLEDALYTAGKNKGKSVQSFNPLVQDGVKIVPSVTRVFSRTKDLDVFLQAYQPMAEAPRTMAASVALYRGAVKVWEAPLHADGDQPGSRLKVVPFRFRVPLEGLDPGEYLCQVTVLDPESQRASFWQAPVRLIP